MTETTAGSAIAGSDPHHDPGDAVAADDAPHRSRHRSRMSPSQQRIIVGVALCGGVLGALSPGEPTGQPVVDAVYRGLFVAGLALAATRARRWTLIVGSAVAVVGSIGLGLLCGGIALVMAVFFAWRDIRNRIYGAVLGTFLALALLRLDVDWFLGASLLLAAVATGLVLWSCYRVARRRTRRAMRWIAVTAGVVVVVGTGMAVYQAISFAEPLRDAVDVTKAGVTATQNGDTAEATKQFESATRRFREVADDASAWWLAPARLVPVVAQNTEVISVMSDAGADLTQAAGVTTSEVDYSSIRRQGGGVDLALLDRFADPVVELSKRLAVSSEDVARLDSPWIVSLLAEGIDEFETKVADLRNQTDLAAVALRDGPALFGGDGPRRYLVLLGNPAELRDLGGHIGNWAELTMVDGRITLEEVGRPLELTQPALESAVAEDRDLPPSFLSMQPARYPQNWGAAVDFPTDARVAARLFRARTGREIDGVLYADPYALAAILRITGQVPIPDTRQQLTPDNAVSFLTHDQFVTFADPGRGDEVVTDLIRDIFSTFTTTTLPGPRELGALFGPLVDEGRFRMVSFRPTDQALLGRVGMDLGFAPTEGDDLLAIVTRNANPSKIDSFLRREATYEVDWDPESGLVRATVDVVLRNEAPADGEPAYVIGNSAGAPLGSNVTDLAVVTPFEATRATIDGVSVPITPVREGTVWRHTVHATVPPGGTTRVTIDLEGDVEPGPVYRLRFGGQPLVVSDPVKVSVTSDGTAITAGPGLKVRGDEATASISGTGQTLMTVGLREENG